MMLAALPLLILPRKWGMWLPGAWGRVNLFWLRWIAGVKSEITGWENIPKAGCIIAMKHQSAWETFALLPKLHDPTFILKKELQYVPFFGWFTMKFKQIPVARGKRSVALAAMMEKAKEAIEEDRNIIIYPEGTRMPAGAETRYKVGIAHMYAELGCPVIPVAVNSGVYWPRRRFFRFPGTIKAQILKPIHPGMEMGAFLQELERRIETTSSELFEEAAQETPDNIIIKEARERQRTASRATAN